VQAEVEAAKAYRESLQTALTDLDDGTEEEEEVSMMEDMAIHYEEFADEFAKISLEIAERVARDDTFLYQSQHVILPPTCTSCVACRLPPAACRLPLAPCLMPHFTLACAHRNSAIGEIFRIHLNGHICRTNCD
jgi:hypothetical protein